MLNFVINIIETAFGLIRLLILIRIILSWIPMARNSFTNLIYNLTEPLLSPIRRLLGKSPIGKGLMIDFSPWVLLLILTALKSVIYYILLDILLETLI